MGSPVDRAISTLNSLQIGEMERIRRRLVEVRRSLEEVGEPNLLAKLEEAQTAIVQGDVPLFRKRIQHVVSRLGHLR